VTKGLRHRSSEYVDGRAGAGGEAPTLPPAPARYPTCFTEIGIRKLNHTKSPYARRALSQRCALTLNPILQGSVIGGTKEQLAEGLARLILPQLKAIEQRSRKARAYHRA